MPDRIVPPAAGAPGAQNGTCGRLHGEVVGQLAAHGQTLARLEEHTQRQWHAIGDRLRWKMFCWITGALIATMTAAAGTFALAQRVAIKEHGEALAECAKRSEETDRRYQEIMADIREIAVHVEYLRRHADRDEGRDAAVLKPSR